MDKAPIVFEAFEALDFRIGTILSADISLKAVPPAYFLEVDFGELGIKTTSARITVLYDASELVGKQVIALVNIPPRRVAGKPSECLILGLAKEDGSVILLTPSAPAVNGTPVK